ncbi:hypothetical protein MBBAR_1c02760 [Methanobrevibacter arboriphilus JCM 13429 = DSM 1125]|uniref:Endonuclease GajA/Old nuclease/RecF-like AAA domain-containing protein n=1 Tax=Methanobrevibacter arboriphilus JCM 13429 = DSM 1125 TaxID=1300164 RepID=A0A1V6N5W1_METAZ|nr:AAA family ATPase [Methanobrevibacter arboriphilus]OQD59866.1 hypothetical protein MBBAR_1c02760 [Methanobrevibacter arboriphilus JCM 13429 = DSM 1125]
MKIKNFNVENFKSIKNSGTIDLEKDITTLIGINEAGKSNILEALHFLNYAERFTYNELPLDSDLKEKYENGEDFLVLTVDILLKPDEIKNTTISGKIRDIITVKKFFSDNYKIYDNNKLIFEYKSEDVKKIANELKEILIKIENEDDDENENRESLKKELEGRIVYFPTEYEINELTDDTQAIDSFKSEYDEKLESLYTEINKRDDNFDEYRKLIPQVVLYEDKNDLTLEFNIKDINLERDHHKIPDLFKLSEIDFVQLKEMDNDSFVTELKRGSKLLTEKIRARWNEKSIEIEIHERNGKIFMTLTDKHLKSSHNLKIRSDGLNQFLRTFVVNNAKNYKNKVLLFDDVGVYLHAKGQLDLLDTFKELSNENQVIISTHSPFMIDTNKLSKTRAIIKTEENGTLIDKNMKKRGDSYHTIRLAMGIPLDNSLILNSPNVLVEGEVDKIILDSMYKILELDIPLESFTSLPCAGCTKVIDMAHIALTYHKMPAILLDSDDSGKKSKEEVKKLLPDVNVIDYGDLKGLNGKLEIENLIDIDYYLKSLNNVHSNDLDQELTKSDFTKRNPTFRDIKLFFKGKHLKLDKREIALDISKRIDDEELPPKKTIQNFKQLFELINDNCEK